MIRGSFKMAMIDDAQKVFDEMTYEPDLVTYNTMVSRLCKKGLMDNARCIADRMIGTKDCLPDMVTYTTLIDGFCKSGKLDEEKMCFEEILSRNCDPNVLTYNVMINVLCLSKNVDEAKRMMTRMRLSGLKDDVATHTMLVLWHQSNYVVNILMIINSILLL